MEITQLLISYKKIRDGEVDRFGEHHITPPDNHCKKIKTLDCDFYRPLSPMLTKRFEFCSHWKDAYLSQDWLSLQEINSWEENKKICELIALRKENSYKGDPLKDLPNKNIAIFSINPYEPEEIYLIWDDNNIEPKIWHHFSAEFFTFNNFGRFLLYINGLIEDEDTIRKTIWDMQEPEENDFYRLVHKNQPE